MKEITLNATVENIQTVTDFVNEQLENADFPLKATMQIDIAIDELFGNIAQYAYYPSTGVATVQVEITDAPRSVTITFTDQGTPYNPLENRDPNTTLSADERDVGGLGIFMAKNCVDSISYEYKDNKNILCVKKAI